MYSFRGIQLQLTKAILLLEQGSSGRYLNESTKQISYNFYFLPGNNELKTYLRQLKKLGLSVMVR